MGMKSIYIISIMIILLASFGTAAITYKNFGGMNITENMYVMNRTFTDKVCLLNGTCFDTSSIGSGGSGGAGNVSSIIGGDMISTSGTSTVTLNINRTEFNDSVDVRANYTAGDSNLTILDKVIKLAFLDLSQFNNSLGWITNAVGDLTNYSLTSSIISWISGNRTASESDLRGNIDGNFTALDNSKQDNITLQNCTGTDKMSDFGNGIFTCSTDQDTIADVNKTYVDAQDLIINTSAITWVRNEAYFNSILNFTETLTDGLWCQYDSSNSAISCNVTPVVDTTINNCSVDQSCPNVIYTTDKLGNTTTEIRAQVSAGSNISYSSGVFSIAISSLNKYLKTLFIELNDTFSGDMEGTYDATTVVNTQGLSGENITEGTVADAYIDSALARDKEINVSYVNTQDNTKFNITGGNFSGGIKMGNNNITLAGGEDIFSNGTYICHGKC